MSWELMFGAIVALTVVRYVVLVRLDRRRSAYAWVAFGFGFVPPIALLGYAGTIARTSPPLALACAAVAFGFTAFIAVWIHGLTRDPVALDAALVVASGGNVSHGLRRWILGLTIAVGVLYLLAQVLIQST